MLALWLIVHWALLPRIDQWRPWIEARASQAIGQTLKIGHIRADSRRWVPLLHLEDVRLLDDQGRTALALGNVQAAPSARALLAWQLRFVQLHVDGVQLDVRRDAQGRIRVAGQDAQAGATELADSRAADWLFAQPEIVIRRGSIRWTDELRAAPPLALTDVDLVLRNGLRRHQLRLDATPPADWGERFTLMGQFTQPLLAAPGQWSRWSGTAYAHLPLSDLSQLHRSVALPFDLHDGRGALRLWMDLDKGEWRAVTADLALADVDLRLAPHLLPLDLRSVSGRFSAARSRDGVDVRAQALSVVSGDGMTWPVGDLSLQWQTAGGDLAKTAPATGGHLKAQRLDLGIVGLLAPRLPLGQALEGTLRSLSPSGLLSDLDLRWSGPPDAPTHYQARGRVSRLVLAPQDSGVADVPGRPGVAGADIEFDLDESAGKAVLAMRQGALHFPGVFEDAAIPLAWLDARLGWQVRRSPGAPPSVELRVTDARFANDDASGDLSAVWRTGTRPGTGPDRTLPGLIDLSGNLLQARADRVAAYLPLQLPASVRHWVGRAVQGGRIENGRFAVRGDVARVPFVDGSNGTFRISGRLVDARFDYLPSIPVGAAEPAWSSTWPGFTQVSGDLLFERGAMRIDRMQGRLWGVQLRDVQARIDNLMVEPLLRVQGEGQGPVSDLLRFVHVSPVGGWLHGELEPLAATGQGDLQLDLGIPLLQPERTVVKGSVLLAGSDLQLRPDLPMLAGARGRVDFSEHGFQIVGGAARALGGELGIEGGTQPDGSLRFLLQGTATADGLRKATEFAPLPAVAQALRGQTAWRAQVAVSGGQSAVSVSSDLVGLGSDWPAPLNKPAATALPLRWSSTPQTPRPGEAPRDQWRLDLGSLMQLRLLREWPADAASRDAPRVLGGVLAWNDASQGSAAMPVGQLQVRGRLTRLDADEWQRALERLTGGADTGGLPRIQLAMQLGELRAAGRSLTQTTIDARQDTASALGPWQLQLQADQLAGRATWRPPRGPGDGGALVARLERLSIGQSELPQVEQLLEAGPSRLPALDVQVDTLEWQGHALGALNLQAASRPGGSGRDWTLEHLDLSLPGAHLSGSGRWTAPERPGDAGRTVMDLALDLQDSGRLAARFGWVDAVRGGSGQLSGRLGWRGSPATPDWATLDGSVRVLMRQGQFLKAEPGIGRVLGILSLQSLPRRLLLDFRDVFQQGFAFDQVSGDVRISRGRATTENLHMRGVQASVHIDGTADLLRETQDLRVVIVPEVNAGAASLAYAAVNPAVGLGTFLAQLLLRDPIRAAGAREFVVSGPLGDPRIVRVERSSAAPLPEVPLPVAPASAPAGAVSPTSRPTEQPG